MKPTARSRGGVEAEDLGAVDRSALPDAPFGSVPQIANVNKLVTASWTQGQRVYVLATEGDEAAIRRYLN